jgi:hypothetical protein
MATEPVPQPEEGAADDALYKNPRPANVFPEPITWHSGIENVAENLWIVRGGVTITGLKFPATMTIVRDANSGHLVLFNCLRLDDEFNQQILALAASPTSAVHVVRLAGYHGQFDGFWAAMHERCKLWALPTHPLQEGLRADFELSAESPLPIAGSKVFVFDLPRSEAAVVLPNGFAVFGDAVFNLRSFDYVGFRMFMPYILMGFYGRRHCPGPIWVKMIAAISSMERIREEFGRLLSTMDFDSYIPAHGVAEIGEAKQKIRNAVARM